MAGSKLGWGLLIGGAALYFAAGRKRAAGTGGDSSGEPGGGDLPGRLPVDWSKHIADAIDQLCLDPAHLSAGQMSALREKVVRPVYAVERAKVQGGLSPQQLTALVDAVAAEVAASKCRLEAGPAALDVLRGLAQALWAAEPGGWSGL